METIRMFAAPHKALRKTMAAFVVQAGQTNFSNADAVEKLKQTGSELFLLLNSHAHTEDSIILSALELKLPGSSEHDKLDHINIEHLQQELETDLKHLSCHTTPDEAHDFYLKFSAFHSLYVEHMHEEETVTQELIWEHLSPEEQLEVRIKIISNMDPAVYAIWLKHIIPAQNENENLAILGAIRQNMPAERFAGLFESLGSKMPKEDFDRLMDRLEISQHAY